MRVIKETSLNVLPKDAKGVHLVVDDDAACNHVCFCFDRGGQVAQCENYRKLPTGVKVCCKNKSLI